MDNTTVDSMCRCCAAEGIFKDIKTSYLWMGEEEVYGDMLRECFDVKLATIEEGGICEVCITQLRNAVNFKKQVVHTEKKFKRHLESRRFKPTEVKEEVSGDNGNSSDDNDNGGADSEDDEDYVPDFEIPIKTESPEEAKSRKRSAKATTSRAKKSRSSDVAEKSKLTIQKEKTLAKIKVEPGTSKGSNITDMRIKLVKPLQNTKLPNGVLYNKLLDNIKEILENSNATPLRRVNGLDYVCAFCDYQHPKPAELKTHTITTHSKETFVTSTKRMTASSLLVKLDITSLRCNMCHQNLQTLEQLLDHLQDSHMRKLHMDVKNQILPFKFGNGPLNCFICDTTFPSFKLLNVHVNTHYRNYVCNVCGVGFVNPDKLRIHMQTHKKGSFVCSQCFKDFDTNVKRKSHEKQVHGPKHQRLKCWHCNERFEGIVAKEKHMTEAHGIVYPTPKCASCDKVFISRKALNGHIKRVHLMDRRHDCPECDMKFFASLELKNHMLKHTGDRQFQCEVCLKRYSRKSTLREHMRIHTNDRRFKCEHCGMTFVQKCSWKGHMRNKHGDYS